MEMFRRQIKKMITVLYLVTAGAWFDLKEFNNGSQIGDCLTARASIESDIDNKLTAVCLTKSSDRLIVNEVEYRRLHELSAR